MASAVQSSGGDGLRLEHLSLLDLGRLTLAVNRLTGKWVMLASPDAAALHLAVTAPEGASSLERERGLAVFHRLSQSVLAEPEPPPPEDLNTLILKLTKACNYACTYCYDHEKVERATSLGSQLAIESIKQALAIATERLHVIFHGGEPTLVFDVLKDAVLAGSAEARKQGKRIVFTGQTNGSRISADLVQFSEEYDVRWGVSLDGPSPANDAFRVTHEGLGTYSDFERAYSAYPAFLKRCAVMTTVTSRNCRELLAVARHFRDLGFASWDWSLFQDIGRGRESVDSHQFDQGDLVGSWNQIFEAVLSGEFDGFTLRPVLGYIESFLYGSQNTKNMCMRRHCGAARDLLSVSSDGTIEACDCIDPFGPLARLGSMRSSVPEPMALARQSPVAALIRSRDVTQLKCRQCIWLSMCGGTCMAHAGDVDKIWDPQCALAINAFEAIARSLAESNRLRMYVASCKSASR